MSNVEEEGTFNYYKVTIVNDSGESVVVSLNSLEEKAGLLKYSIMVCPNEMKFLLKVPLTLEMLNQFARFLDNKIPEFTSADSGFEMYLFSKRYFISHLESISFYYLVRLTHSTHVCRVHDLACKYNEKQLQRACFNQFLFSDRSIFRTDYFRSCEETTIHKLLTSPLYRSLEEFDLLMGLRMWVEKTFLKLRKTNANISKRDVMKPFISFIRFFVLDPDSLKQIVDNFIKDQILTEEEVQSIRQYLTEKNVALLQKTISANGKRRNINDLSSILAINQRARHQLNACISMKPNFQFMADVWFCENCYAHTIKLPIIHMNPKGINVLVGVKSAYSHDFLYEKCICFRDGLLFLRKVNLLPKRSFYIFLVTIPEKEVNSNLIVVMKDTNDYIPAYNFPDETTSEEENVKFLCSTVFYF
ncbi:uncharacterized protein LOC111619172 [Centruroides sculpturatus]|uniref:uncharacterized protein LOC111619172 n=1 Tax=Centruroides sculpturatus TaxID=218467 RepID=UPI000C6E0D86|nr:uncharacterized protein LOC111619172 [Centruroides sculpturatus]